MADNQVPSQSQPANHLSEDVLPPPAAHQPHGYVQQRVAGPHVVGNDQQNIHREGIPQPIGNLNVAMQDQIQYPHHIGAPHYNAAQNFPPLPPYPEVPYVHIHRDVGAAQGVQVQAHAFAQAPGIRENHGGPFGYGAQFPVAGPPEGFPGIWPHPAPRANVPQANGLRNLAGRYLNNPDTLVNVVRIEPSPDGRFEVWIVLELGDIF
ncbi:hypothetical protein EDB89DRAFT_2233138 [Lactarius sanguifluus]|nr:hypothetical protein EDB89DRAFT_2233138 [Lactarius sanguifluus]